MTSPRRIALAVLIVALPLAAGGARAELVEVRQVAGGMECAECARNLRMEVGRLDGVSAADASWNRRILTVHFRPSSRVTLEDLRAVVRRNHFSVREADVVIRGRVVQTPSGGLQLAVSGSGAVYPIAATAAAPGPAGALAARLERAAAVGREVTLRGRIAGDDATHDRTPASGIGTDATTALSPIWILEIVSAGAVS